MSANEKRAICAYILINIKLGFTESVIAKLKEIHDITSVAVITGEYDAIVRLETASLEEMHDRTLEIHVIDGIIETTTSIIQIEFT